MIRKTSLSLLFEDEECEIKRNDVDDNYERVEKLDICMYYVFAYIARAHNQQFSLGISEIKFSFPFNF